MILSLSNADLEQQSHDYNRNPLWSVFSESMAKAAFPPPNLISKICHFVLFSSQPPSRIEPVRANGSKIRMFNSCKSSGGRSYKP